MRYSDKLISIISEKSILQRKYLADWSEKINQNELQKFDLLIEFYIQMGKAIEEIADSYLYMCNFYTEDLKYFLETGTYRCTNISDAISNVYNNENVMKYYMTGLSISTYLWEQHRELLRFFIKNCNMITDKTGDYLEIGPGHGEYFVTAIEHTHFDTYTAIDISETSVSMTKAYCKFILGDKSDTKYEISHKDFFDFTSAGKYDAVIMGEVLEHVENPKAFLDKIYEVAKNDAFIYISTAINAPQPDHIYHFKTISEVQEMIHNSGFDILYEIPLTSNNISIEKALKKKYAIVVGYVLTKRK